MIELFIGLYLYESSFVEVEDDPPQPCLDEGPSLEEDEEALAYWHGQLPRKQQRYGVCGFDSHRFR